MTRSPVPDRYNLTPPDGAEMAAIVAAVDAAWPRPVAPVSMAERRARAWRWSGRWWGPKPAAQRRRPWL
jgi:hypothetical protein